jgi:4-hydroxyphenylpyruvate dioxygenase
MNGIGLNGATLAKRDLLTKIRAAADAGFDFYEPRVPELLVFDTPDGSAYVQQVLAEAGLSWLPLNALEGVFSALDGGTNTTAERIFPLAKRFGIEAVIAVPAPPGNGLAWRDAVSELERIRGLAEDHGLRLLYELIGFPHHAFPSLDLAADLAREAGIPLVLDTFHLAVSQTQTNVIAGLAADRIGLVHLSDAILGGRPVTEITDGDRVLPGEGDLPLRAIVETIGKTGFAGPISVEVFHPKYGNEDAGLVAERALQAAKRLTRTWDGPRSATGKRKE